jgi:hypothetical protein
MASEVVFALKRSTTGAGRNAYLEAILVRTDEHIAQAQMRVERHSRLMSVDRNSWQQRLHADAHFNLQEGLRLLRLQRAMLLSELSGSMISTRYAAAFERQRKRERIATLREVLTWLDSLRRGPLANIVDGQRQRAIEELARLQNLD